MAEAAEQLWTEQQEAAYQAAVTEAKERYNQAQGAWIDFTMYLREIEIGGAWKRPAFARFADFLRAEFPAAYGIERYSNIVKAVEVYGSDFMRRLGPDVAHCLVTDSVLTTAGATAKIREWCEAHFSEHGVMPEYNTIIGYTKRATQAPRLMPKLIRNRDELAQLRTENARLRAELKAAKVRIRELERDLKAARQQVAKCERSSGAATAATARKGTKTSKSAQRAR